MRRSALSLGALALGASMLVALAAAALPVAPAAAQPGSSCVRGELVAGECVIVGPAPTRGDDVCPSDAIEEGGRCHRVVDAIRSCRSPYRLSLGLCRTPAVFGGDDVGLPCPGGAPSGATVRLVTSITSPPDLDCVYSPELGCREFFELEGSSCRQEVPRVSGELTCSSGFELEEGACVRREPPTGDGGGSGDEDGEGSSTDGGSSDGEGDRNDGDDDGDGGTVVVDQPGRVTLVYDFECGPDGRVGLIVVERREENGARIAAITINGSAAASARLAPRSMVRVDVLTSDPDDDRIVSGPSTTPSCDDMDMEMTEMVEPMPDPPRRTTPDPRDPPAVARVPEIEAEVAILSCLTDTRRAVLLTSIVEPPSSVVSVQWSIDGAPIGEPQPAGSFSTTIDADGELHRFELALTGLAGQAPSIEPMVVDVCVEPGMPMIDVAGCDADGRRELVLVSTGGDEVQWLIDGMPLAPAGPPGTRLVPVPADGEPHLIELQQAGGAPRVTESIVLEACPRRLSLEAVPGPCVSFGALGAGRGVDFRVALAPMTGRELVQLRIDGVDVGAPTLPRNLVRAFRGDGAVHVAEVALVEPAVGARATAEFTVGECTSDQMVRTAMATLRQHGRSELALPTECGGMSIAVPGVARLEDLGAANASTSRFATDATELDVGSHVVTLGCQGTIVDLEVFVYHQIGGDRGQSRAIATNAAIGAAVGVAAIGPRRRWL